MTPPAVRHAFTYGTLRADYCESGDRWGVIQDHPTVKWTHGRLGGYACFQQKGLFYPFACRAAEVPAAFEAPPGGLRVVGTLLTWEDDGEWREALERMDPIEGYTPGKTGGLYERAVEVVQPTDAAGAPVGEPVPAYVYHQFWAKGSGSGAPDAVEYIQDGDWLQHTRRMPQ
eukprot:TRINITY_DN446_c0_g1_i12.p3 TRINITY_DN446_c0_g1~~TRINITY_DN446_c0_g1_i12.p3  ORF type:complete len:172 (+),score=40.19 TRINITY_DN446_c0_g1_i12:75-590(+)